MLNTREKEDGPDTWMPFFSYDKAIQALVWPYRSTYFFFGYTYTIRANVKLNLDRAIAIVIHYENRPVKENNTGCLDGTSISYFIERKEKS